jgi:hypothetical protein
MVITIVPGNGADFEDGSIDELAAELRETATGATVNAVPSELRGRGVTWPQVIHIIGDVMDVAAAAILIDRAIRWAHRRYRKTPADDKFPMNRPHYIAVERTDQNGKRETLIAVQVRADGKVEDHTDRSRRLEGREPLADVPKFAPRRPTPKAPRPQTGNASRRTGSRKKSVKKTPRRGTQKRKRPKR